MAERIYFRKGCRGRIVETLQQGLLDAGVAPQALVAFADGDFGGKTELSVRALQAKFSLPVTGQVDAPTWGTATGQPLPSMFDRALQLTADFEGHGFRLAKGNFDGAGVTWGVIGFTLKGGELQKVIQDIDARQPGTVDAAFGDLAAEWRSVLAKPWSEQLTWADGITISQSGVLSPRWAAAFARLGAVPAAQTVQLDRARAAYFDPAVKSADLLGLKSERGLAMCFDTHVQSGGIRNAVKEAAKGFPAATPEADRLVRLADAIADAVTTKYKEDVRARRRCIATGTGVVHGARYDVGAWGIDLP